MDTLTIGGVGAAGTLEAQHALGYQVNSIEFDIPLDEVGTTDPSVTLSGIYTGAITFHNDATFTKEFGYNEVVHITSELSTAEYSAVIDYVLFGDMGCPIMPALDGMKSNFIPIPRRLQ